MNGIIEALKARKQRNAAMLDLGRSSGSGSGLLLKSSSLQPQTVFRELKSSFSVKRPPMNLLNTRSMASFSQKAEMKYSAGPSLLHLHRTPSGSVPSVQRAPAAMPLPVPGGAPAAQPAAETPAFIPSSPVSSAPAYPPKSERRPVVFDRSDGPSDLEKRIMAAKRQKQAQEAKQRGPDRRQVRTERVEISSSGNPNEINREVLLPSERNLPKPVPAEKAPETRTENTVQREPLRSAPLPAARAKPAAAKPAPEVRPAASNEKTKPAAAVNTVQREITDSEGSPEPVPEPVTPDISVLPAVQREYSDDSSEKPSSSSAAPSKRPAGRTQRPAAAVPAKAMPTVRREISGIKDDRAVSNAPETMSSGTMETVQREIPDKKESKPDMPAPEKAAPSETVRRKILKASPAAEKSTKQEKLLGQKSVSAETVQRVPLAASPVSSKGPDRDLPVPQKAAVAETVQREPLMASPVTSEKTEPVQPASEKTASAETVRREIPDAAQAAQKAAAAETVQREIPEAAPVSSKEPEPVLPVPQKTAAAETVQREITEPAQVKPMTGPAETIRREIHEASPIPQKPAAETVQREMSEAAPVSVKGPEPVMAIPQKAAAETVQREMPEAVPVSVKGPEPVMAIPQKTASETIQREMPEAAPVSVKGPEPVPSVPQKSAASTVQREMAESSPASSKGPDPVMAVPQKSAAETVQREIAEASPVAGAEAVPDMPVPQKAAVSDTVMRETTDSAPAAANDSAAEMPAPKKAVPAKTVQREPLKAAPAAQKISSQEKKPAAASVVRREGPGRTDTVPEIQRESAAPQSGQEDIHELLRKLPTHFEMPREQIDAMRSTGLNTSSSAVQREYDAGDQASESTPPDNRSGRPAADTASQNVIRRQSEFVLPKTHNVNKTGNASGEKNVQREMDPDASTGKPSGAPGIFHKPQRSFGQNGFTGNKKTSFGMDHGSSFSGQPSGVVQREMLDEISHDTGPELAAAEASDGQQAKQVLEDLIPEVTAAQLDTLADKLLPRIKRIMRAEMERNVFR